MIYKSSQKLPWWIWVFVAAALAVTIPIIIKQYVSGEESIWSLVIVITLFSLVGWILLTLELEVRIGERAVQFRFKPFIWSWQKIKASDITEYHVQDIQPIKDYLGYGFRWTSSRGKALIMRAGAAVYLEYKKGKSTSRLTLTVNDLEKSKQAMSKIMESRHNG